LTRDLFVLAGSFAPCQKQAYAVHRAIDVVADDTHAMTLRAAAQRSEAQVLADRLAAERDECALIEIAHTQGSLVDYRPDCDPRAVLGFEWVVVPARPK
jgi:hypothetical protein